MNKTHFGFRVVVLTALSLVSFWNESKAQLNRPCASVEIVGQECSASAIKANLNACKDEVIEISKLKCSDTGYRFRIRGRDQDYQVVMKKGSGAWGENPWVLESEKVIPTRSSAKSLPVTPNDRKKPSPVSVVTTEKDPVTDAPKVSSAFIFSAHLDAYYSHNFNRPNPTAGGDPQNNLRYYDFYNNQMSLNLAEITIKHIRKETSFLLDLDFGQFADYNTRVVGLQATGGPSAGSAADEVMKHVGQAIFTYTPSGAPGWIFEVGKMPTHVGLELMKSKDNWNYTRSSTFSFGGPFWHTGAHVGYSLMPGVLAVNTYLYNGWNTMNDNNFSPTYGGQIKWSPTDKLTWVYNYIGGPERTNNQGDWKQVHETNLTYVFTPTFTMASDFLYGMEDAVVASGDAHWFGAELAFKWQTSPTYYISPRFEYYFDRDGYTLGGEKQALWGYTLTNSYLISEGFELRLEGRLDVSTRQDRFNTKTGTSRFQPTALLGILYTM